MLNKEYVTARFIRPPAVREHSIRYKSVSAKCPSCHRGRLLDLNIKARVAAYCESDTDIPPGEPIASVKCPVCHEEAFLYKI